MDNARSDQRQSAAFQPAEGRELLERYQRVATRARSTLITTLVLRGRTAQDIAEELQIPESEVNAHIEQAVIAARDFVHMMPEGPLFIGEAVLDGYAGLVNDVLTECRIGIEEIKENFKGDVVKKHVAIQGYLKLKLDAVEKLANRMQEIGIILDRRPKKNWGPGNKLMNDDVQEAAVNSFHESASQGRGAEAREIELRLIKNAEGDDAGSR